MRRNQSHAVQTFIRSALACTCLAVVPFAGCSNSSGKNFSLGLRKEAAESALKAEEELAERKQQEAAIAKADAEQDRDEGRTRVRIAGPWRP